MRQEMQRSGFTPDEALVKAAIAEAKQLGDREAARDTRPQRNRRSLLFSSHFLCSNDVSLQDMMMLWFVFVCLCLIDSLSESHLLTLPPLQTRSHGYLRN